MLELAKLENQRDRPEMAPIDVGAMVNTILETHEPQLAARRLEMEVDVPTGLTVMGNAFLLHQAVANLLQNATDFSPAGGKVTVAAAPDQNQVTLTVTDDGPGVPEYARERIFERF